MKKYRKTVGLALGAGGVRGGAQIGVIQCLLDHQIPIDFVSGTSTGSLVGAFFCSQGNTKQAVDFYKNTQFTLAGTKYVYVIEFRRKLLELKKIFGEYQIENLKIPFSAVATDLHTGLPKFFQQGSLSQAVAASTAVPFLLPSIRQNKHVFVDGAMTMPVPAPFVRQKCDLVIAVNLLRDIFPAPDYKVIGKFSDVYKSCYASVLQLTKYNLMSADFVIEPEGLTSEVKSAKQMADVIESGYQSTLPLITKIQSSLSSPR